MARLIAGRSGCLLQRRRSSSLGLAGRKISFGQTCESMRAGIKRGGSMGDLRRTHLGTQPPGLALTWKHGFVGLLWRLL